jgi:hypothetical protein
MQVGGKVLGSEWAGHGSGPWDKLEIRTGFFGVCVVWVGNMRSVWRVGH